MHLRRIIFGLLTAALLGGCAAAVSKRVTLQNTQTFTVAAGQTKTFMVGYPDALKYGGSKYSGNVQILTPLYPSGITPPSLGKVKILSKGSCLGGSDYCASVRNANKTGTARVGVRITTTTELPPGKKK